MVADRGLAGLLLEPHLDEGGETVCFFPAMNVLDLSERASTHTFMCHPGDEEEAAAEAAYHPPHSLGDGGDTAAALPRDHTRSFLGTCKRLPPSLS